MITSRISGRSVIGLVVVVIGVLLLLSALGVTGIGSVIKWAPSLVIAYGVWQLVSDRFNRPFGPVLIIVIASIIQLWVLGISIGNLWPVVLIFLGLSIIFGRRGFRKGKDRPSDEADGLSTVGFLSHTRRRPNTQAFKGGNVTAVLGKVEIDLRDANLEEAPVTLEITSVLGEVMLKVLPDWSVDFESVTVLGEASDERRMSPASEDGGPNLTVTGLVMLGSLKITD